MADIPVLLFVLAAGFALGVLFFWGLWWTVQKALTSSRPARWFLASLAVRMAIVLAGLYVLAGHDWRRLVAGLVGIVLARVVLTNVIRRGVPDGHERDEVTGHAP